MKLGNWNDTPPLSEKEFADVKKQVDQYFTKQSIKARHAMAQEAFRNAFTARVATKIPKPDKQAD